MRSGTLPTHQIVGMGEAYRIAQLESHAEIERLNQYRDQIEAAIEQVGGIRCNGQRGVPHILNITIEGVDAERLMAAMPQIAVSTGSACNSATIEPSHVLQSMGLTRQQGLSSLRISLGRMTTADEVSILTSVLTDAVSQLRSAA
jgi:cysteine desulfurase